MSLLSKPRMTTRWKKMLLVLVSILLLVPCVAAAAFNMRFDLETNVPQDPASQEPQREKVLERRKYELSTMKEIPADPQLTAEIERRAAVEIEMMAIKQAALVKLARINMDQAIQTASSQNPGKVMSATLDAKGWEEPGKLAKDGIVFYRVVIADEVTGDTTYVWVNAVDGTLLKTEREKRREPRSPEK